MIETNSPAEHPAVGFFRWLYIVLAAFLCLSFGAMFAAAFYVLSSPSSGIMLGGVVLVGVVDTVMREGFGVSLVPWIRSERVQGRELPRRYAGLMTGYAVMAWCIYGGLYLPYKYGQYDNLKGAAHDRYEPPEPSVGEDNVGETLD
jgi:hypothetical protein